MVTMTFSHGFSYDYEFISGLRHGEISAKFLSICGSALFSRIALVNCFASDSRLFTFNWLPRSSKPDRFVAKESYWRKILFSSKGVVFRFICMFSSYELDYFCIAKPTDTMREITFASSYG